MRTTGTAMRWGIEGECSPAAIDDAADERGPARRVRSPAMEQQHTVPGGGGRRTPFIELKGAVFELEATKARFREQRCIGGVESTP